MRDAESIGRVGLVALRRHRRAHMAGLETYHRQPHLLQSGVQPRRQRAGFMANTTELLAIRHQRRRDRRGIARYRCGHHDLSSLVDDTDRGFVDRHIQSDKAVHLRSPALSNHTKIGRAGRRGQTRRCAGRRHQRGEKIVMPNYLGNPPLILLPPPLII
jgi:hypothetical protein